MTPCRVKLYSRDNAPVCYEANLFPGMTRSPEKFIRQLLMTGHSSYWASVRTRPPMLQTDAPSPRARALTQLNSDTLDLLSADMTEQNEDGYGRELTILTARDGNANESRSFDDASWLLEEFVGRQTGPLELVYFQLDDSPSYVFVKVLCSQAIESFLADQKLHPVEKKCILPYRKLGRLQIESVRNNILALSFPDDPRTKDLRRVP